MQRRDFLKYTSALALSGICPSIFANDNSGLSARRVILIELKGGNDGLNTLIPYKDQLYKTLRPNLSKVAKYRIIDDGLGIGLNSELKFFGADNKLRSDVAILHSVGYKNVNKSHFKGIKYWENASLNFTKKGWIARALDDPDNKFSKRNTSTKGVVIGDKVLGPFTRTTSDVLIVDDLRRMLKPENIARFNVEEAKGNHNLRHILNTETSITNQLKSFHEVVNVDTGKAQGFEKDVATLINIVSAFPQIPAFKLSLGGFDTHRNQNATHNGLLKKLNNGIKRLVDGLKRDNLYHSTLIMTYSEFGRRPKENGSRGTDHGDANCHFLLGGKVKGGKIYYGKEAKKTAGKGGYELNNNASQNIDPKIDFRDVYQEILTKWWKVKGLDKYKEEGDDLGYDGPVNKLNFLEA